MPELTLARLLTWIGAALFTLIFLLWLAGGLYQVRPGEQAAVVTFGAARPEPVSEQGLKWHWPSPIGNTRVVQVRKSRTTDVGFHTLPEGQTSAFTGENWQPDLNVATMITGDLNLVEVQLTGQYHIKDLNKYLFAADDPGIEFEYTNAGNDRRTHRSHPAGRPDGQTIKDALEIALRKAMGTRNIDQALVQERDQVTEEVRQQAQATLDLWNTGLELTAVQLQQIKPPDEVQAAFDDVLRAREERDTRINQSLTYRNKILPEARGQAEQIVKSADAYSAQVTNRAQGEADAFTARRVEYETAPAIIAQRMYLEMLESVAPNLSFIINGDANATIILNQAGTRITPLPQNSLSQPAPPPVEDDWEPEPLPIR